MYSSRWVLVDKMKSNKKKMICSVSTTQQLHGLLVIVMDDVSAREHFITSADHDTSRFGYTLSPPYKIAGF